MFQNMFQEAAARKATKKFARACVTEAGNKEDGIRLMEAANNALANLKKALAHTNNLNVVFAHADKDFTGDKILTSINKRIFSEDVPESLSGLFHRQSDIIRETAPEYYKIVVRDMPERIKQNMAPDIPAEKREAMTEAWLNMGLLASDELRNLGDSLSSAANNLAALSPQLQRDVIKIQQDALIEHNLLPNGLQL